MSKGGFIFIIGLVVLIIASCKKEEPEVVEPALPQSNIAPCTLNEQTFSLDSVFYGNSVVIPEAKFSAKFVDTAVGSSIDFIEFGFNKVPTTGMYHMVNQIDTNSQVIPNQISFRMYGLGIDYRAFGTNDPIIYIENNANELIISYCDLPNQQFNLNVGCNCYVGNGEGFLKYRLEY